jgi:hypothetical protein
MEKLFSMQRGIWLPEIEDLVQKSDFLTPASGLDSDSKQKSCGIRFSRRLATNSKREEKSETLTKLKPKPGSNPKRKEISKVKEERESKAKKVKEEEGVSTPRKSRSDSQVQDLSLKMSPLTKKVVSFAEPTNFKVIYSKLRVSSLMLSQMDYLQSCLRS